MSTSFSVALEGEGVKKCGLTDLSVHLTVFYLSAASREMLFIKNMFCCL